MHQAVEHFDHVLFNDYAYVKPCCDPMSVDIGKFANTTVMVCIGNGTVVGSNSVITKDVLPYAIVGGVTKVVHQRFPQVIAKALEATA